MGLRIHSLGELPTGAERGYYVYLLDYGWYEPLGKVLADNLDRMGDIASRHNAVVLRGTEGSHFEDEVLSWHHIDGQPSEDLLPAILITTQHPRFFKENDNRAPEDVPQQDYPLLLIPLRDVCETTSEVAELINKIFKDIREKKELADFEVAKELNKGIGTAIVDALILEPNFSGVGVNLKKIRNLFKRRKRR